MALEDTTCTLVPYFNVDAGQLDAFKAIGEQMVLKTRTERDVVFYGFSFSGQQAFCREGYRSAEGILAHLQNVGDLLQQALKIANIERLEVHAPADEIDKLRGPLTDLNPTYFTLETGFRN